MCSWNSNCRWKYSTNGEADKPFTSHCKTHICYLYQVLCNNCRKLRHFSRKPAPILKLQFLAYLPHSFNNSLFSTSSFLYVWNNYSPSTSIKIAFLLPLLVLPFIAHLFFVLDSARSLYFIQRELEKLQRPLYWQLATSLCHPVELWLLVPASMQGVETGRLEGGSLILEGGTVSY